MKKRIAVVGAGGVAERIHLPACRMIDSIDVAALCDLNEPLARKTASAFGIDRVYGDLDAMLGEIKPDAVIVGTPPGSHFDICRKSFEAGADVFCEKPFMPSVADADRIIDIARDTNRLLRVNNQYRYMTCYARVAERLRAGKFGRLYAIQAWQQMFHPPARETNWRNQLQQYTLFEFGTHALDLACFFFDTLPDSVQAHTPKHSDYDADVLVQATLRFPGERLGAFFFNRVSHAPEKYLEMRLDCERASIRISLGGVARFKVEWVRQKQRPAFSFGFVRGGQSRVEVDGVSRTLVSAPDREFASATAEHLRVFLGETALERRPLEAAIHARGVLELVFAGYESARTGETVRLSHSRTTSTNPLSR